MKKRRKLKRKVVNILIDCLDHIEFVLAAIEGSADLTEGSIVRDGLAVSRDLESRIKGLRKCLKQK